MIGIRSLVFGLAIILAACTGQDNLRSGSAPAPMTDLAEMRMESSAGFSADQSRSKPPPPPGSDATNPSDQSFLAYRYNHTFELPAENITDPANARSWARRNPPIPRPMLTRIYPSARSRTG